MAYFFDIFVGSALLDLYAKCGEMELAVRVFFYMPEKTVASWNAVLNGYIQMGDCEAVLRLFCGMTESELKCSKFTLSTVLKSFVHSGNLRGGQAVHSTAIKIGCELDEFLACCLLDMYSKCGLAINALNIFRRIKDPNIVAWSTMINCLDKQCQSQEAAKMFCLLRHKGVRPNQHIFAIMVGAASNMGDPHYCEGIHACIFKYGFESNTFVSTALVTMYMKIGSVQSSWWMFEAISYRNLASWNTLLSGCLDNEIFDQAPRILKQMLAEGFRPDIYTFSSILRYSSSLLNVDLGKQVHTRVIKNGLDGIDFLGTALIDVYAKSRCLEDAEVLFNELIERDPFTWTAIITGYAQANQGEKAVKYFRQMQQEGLEPNEFTLSSSLSGCSNLAMLESGQQLHSSAIKFGLSSDTYVASALINMYAKCRSIEEAEAVFKGMASHNTVSLNTIICEYSQHGQGKKALEAFRLMIDEDVLPDEVTFVGVLSACSHMGLIEEGIRYFNSLRKVYGINPTIEHSACMVNILSRAGKFREVESFIEERKLTQNALIWETILWACKLHGNAEFGERAAKKLFELQPEKDYNYIQLAHIFAAGGRWAAAAKVRSLMSNRGIMKEPGCSWLEVHDQGHSFYAQDNLHPKIREINLQLEKLAQ